MSDDVRNLFEFDDFKIDIGERLIFKHGTPISLTPKAFDILAVLIQRSGHLFRKEELLTLVWNESFVEESNLTRNIYLLRKALGESVDGNSYIETVPRKGYRFVANVRVVPIPNHHSLASKPQAANNHDRRWWSFLLVGFVVVTISAVYVLRKDRRDAETFGPI